MADLSGPNGAHQQAEQTQKLMGKSRSSAELQQGTEPAKGADPPGLAPGNLVDRKKSGVVPPVLRKWIRFDRNGWTDYMQADKHALTHRLGVQLRDLRLLDPQLNTSYPSAILCRDKALVLSLEHIRCIVTTEYVLILNAEEDRAVAFLEELERRVRPRDPERDVPLLPVRSQPDLRSDTDPDRPDPDSRPREAPFELRVLEVALDLVCSHLDELSRELEATAHPALDDLTAKVSTVNLERVRRVKNRHVRLVTRVETLREVLEKFLDDDRDMHDMNLSARAAHQLERQASIREGAGGGTGRAGRGSRDAPLSPRSPLGYSPLGFDDALDRGQEAIAEVEMVLETFFMQADHTFNKLQTLGEYIDDTEDYINIELDNNRNQLIRLELLLTASTLCLAIVGVVAGLFGMNLHIPAEVQNNYVDFVLVCVVTSVGAGILFGLIYAFCKWKKLM